MSVKKGSRFYPRKGDWPKKPLAGTSKARMYVKLKQNKPLWGGGIEIEETKGV